MSLDTKEQPAQFYFNPHPYVNQLSVKPSDKRLFDK